MVKWVEQHKILGEIFGNRIHVELVRRSNEIFASFERENVLQNAHLDLLWKASMVIEHKTNLKNRNINETQNFRVCEFFIFKIKQNTKKQTPDETMVRTVYDVFRNIGTCLSTEHLDFVMNRIDEIPIAQLNVDLLALTFKLLESAFITSDYEEDGKYIGLQTLWKVVVSSTNEVIKKKRKMKHEREIMEMFVLFCLGIG